MRELLLLGLSIIDGSNREGGKPAELDSGIDQQSLTLSKNVQTGLVQRALMLAVSCMTSEFSLLPSETSTNIPFICVLIRAVIM